MDKPKSKYTYTIEDTLNGLILTWQSRKRWLDVILGFCLTCLMSYGVKFFIDTFFKKDTAALVVLIGLLWLIILIFYIAYSLFEMLDSLLNLEVITVGHSSIRITKKGLGPFRYTRNLITSGKISVFKHQEGFMGHGSNLSVYISGSRFRLLASIDPMRRFLHGISEQDAISILEKIKARYPQYDIYYRGYTEKGDFSG